MIIGYLKTKKASVNLLVKVKAFFLGKIKITRKTALIWLTNMTMKWGIRRLAESTLTKKRISYRQRFSEVKLKNKIKFNIIVEHLFEIYVLIMDDFRVGVIVVIYVVLVITGALALDLVRNVIGGIIAFMKEINNFLKYHRDY